MEQRQLGDSGLYTSALGFGTWEMSTTMYGHIDVKEASAAVSAAIDHGVTLFDTAEVYGPYHSEELLGKALGNKRNDIVLVSKVGFEYDGDGKNLGRNSKYEHVISRTEGCLERLDTDFLDLLLIHWPDHETPFEESIRALEKLKNDGKIRYFGVSNFTPEMMDECEKYGHMTANQVGYHMFDRRMESAVLPYCKENNINHILHLGDYYDNRKFVNFKALNQNRKHFLNPLREYGMTMDIIPGNHDTYFKNTNDLNSLKECLGHYMNEIHIIMEPRVMAYGSLKIGLVPCINSEN